MIMVDVDRLEKRVVELEAQIKQLLSGKPQPAPSTPVKRIG
jgi:hypothetical protein